MNTMMEGSARVSPRLEARVAGFFWLIVFVAGSLALYLRGGTGFKLANIVAPVCYAVAAVLIYDLLKPVNKNISLVAVIFGLMGCAVSLLGLTRFISVRDLVFFGFHCLLVGYLIFRSTFLPRILGVLMMVAGLGWLTFLWPPLASDLAPYNLMPGMIGEGLLILWLLIVGVNEQKWKGQTSAASIRGTVS